LKPTTLFYKTVFTICFAFAINQFSIAQQTISINNVWELYKNLGSNRILELDTGVYDLNVLLDQQFGGKENIPMGVQGAELINVHDLFLKAKSYGRTMIVVRPIYGWTVYFRNCRNIQLSNIIFGHAPYSYCGEGVLKFVGCSEVEINGCDLFGCGTVGLALDSCSNFKVNGTTIHDCTNGLMDLYTSNNIRFNNVHFKNTKGGIDFMNTPDIYFTKCDFENNDASGWQAFFHLWQQYYMLEPEKYGEEELKKSVTIKTKVYLDSCTVKTNIFRSFTNDRRRLTISASKMENNTIYKEQ
jgi:hypothetical protein